MRLRAFFFLLLAASLSLARADDGYRLWLRYDPIPQILLQRNYAGAAHTITLATPSGKDSPTLQAARDELANAFTGLLGTTPVIRIASATTNPALGEEGYALTRRGEN